MFFFPEAMRWLQSVKGTNLAGDEAIDDDDRYRTVRSIRLPCRLHTKHLRHSHSCGMQPTRTPWHGVGWCAMTRKGVGMTWHGEARSGGLARSIAWHGMAWHGMAWRTMQPNVEVCDVAGLYTWHACVPERQGP